MSWKLARPRIVGAVAAAFLAACAAPSALRDAQDAFNTAASLDNRERSAAELRSGEGQAAASSLSRDAAYAAVIERIEGMTWREKSRLQADKLLGNALTLRVLSLWRLGRFDEARTAADKLTAPGAPEVAARDRTLLEALPALIRIDEAYLKAERPLASDSAEERTTRLAAVQLLVDTANGTLDKLLAKQPRQEPVVGYLIQSQLAADTSLLRAYRKLQSSTLPDIAAEKTHEHFCALQTFKEGRAGLSAEEDRAMQAAVDDWQARLGVNLDEKPCS